VKNNELKAGVIFIIVLKKLLFFCLISYGSDISKNFLHVERKRLSAIVVHRLLCFGACNLLLFNFFVTEAWPFFCLIL
jgi:hypothetical protein